MGLDMTSIWKCVLVVMLARGTIISTAATDENCSETDIMTDSHHENGPLIIPCKKELVLNMGQNFTLTCRGKVKIKFMQQDLPEEVDGPFKITSRTYKINHPLYKYESILDLINVDKYAIGYYACMDEKVKESKALNNLIEEPKDTESVTYIYIYVNGTNSLFAPMREFVTCKSNYYIVECRPTTPDVEVTLNLGTQENYDYYYYNPKIGFSFDSDVLADPYLDKLLIFTCGFSREADTVYKEMVFVKHQHNLAIPSISSTTMEYLAGETFTLNCTVKYNANSALNMTWKYPNDNVRPETITNESNSHIVVAGQLLYSAITINNASKEHEGIYECFVSNICAEKSAKRAMKFLSKPYLKLAKTDKHLTIIERKTNSLRLSVDLLSYPPATYYFTKDNVTLTSLPDYNEKFTVTYKSYSYEVVLSMKNTTVEDSGNYTFIASNGNLTASENFDVRFKTPPKVDFGESFKSCVKGTRTTIPCTVTGYPLPGVTWMFNNTTLSKEISRFKQMSIYKGVSYLNVNQCIGGELICLANNTEGMDKSTKKLVVYELPGGFGILNQTTDGKIWYAEKEDVEIACLASNYNFDNVTWVVDEEDKDVIVANSENQYSQIATLKISNVAMNHSKKYTCRAIGTDGSVKINSIILDIMAREVPAVVMNSSGEEVLPFQPVHLSCRAEGVPRPTIVWYKDDILLNPINETNIIFITNEIDHKTMNSSIFITQMQDRYSGSYKCEAVNNDKIVAETLPLILKAGPKLTYYYIVIAIIVAIFIAMVIFLIWRDKKRKQRFKKELAKAGLLYFKKGATRSLNPELGIDEQAELLPYDERFEFPPDKLILGKQLGAGAFGVVYKAEARGIINAEETTTVAVKMVKKTADNMYIKALASELKIMIHLGKHINIVNLLGACTKNVVKRELVVIVEYCKYGNIHNYMQRHREVFIDQLSDNNKEHTLGKVNIGYSHSGSTGVQSEYYGSVNTQDTFLNSANTNRPGRKNAPNHATEVKASEGYVQPDWRSNYESDYSYEGRTPRPLTSRDLISWAFQIARGMEYLANRKVLHGDLAARNVLLADDNIVKICDFGLARSMYKNDEYKKKENSPLPVKWLAIECMTDNIFSTQSDVWSFGVVLWELFTLAKTPYPNISPADILRYLLEGHRLNKPPYADDKIYNLMKRCWEQKPTARPTFTQLQEILDSYLEDSVRNQYVHLSSAFLDSRPVVQEDYLAMVCAPDYNNMVTPSPHHYVNNTSFFPKTPTKVDDDGYQQMSPAPASDIHSPKSTLTKFDFDARKFNTKPSEASNGGSELTPMLTLNNLPRSGSDSDHEGTMPPYLNVTCPRIDEESDEVFETKQQKNALNSAVTNPIYITLENEKRPPMSTYANIVPNGLVK